MLPLLSLLVPGLGQMVGGRLFRGVLFFVLTVVGYFAVIPGICLHLWSILDASKMGDAKRKADIAEQARLIAASLGREDAN